MSRSNVSNSPSHSMDLVNVTSQMANLGNLTTSNYRKQAFGFSGGHASWPTPPTETDHEFSPDAMDDQSPMADDKSMFTLPSLQENSESSMNNSIHSPPASPALNKWSTKLPPIQSPPDSPVSRTMLPSIKDGQLFSEPVSEARLPLFSTTEAMVSSDDRADSLSPWDKTVSSPPSTSPVSTTPHATSPPADKGIYSIFPQFKGADREFFRKYRDNRYAELKLIPGWRPINRNAHSPQTQSPIVTQPKQRHAELSGRSNRIVKNAPHPRNTVRSPHTKPQVAKLHTTTSPTARQVKTPTKMRERNSASVEPQGRKRAAPSKPVVQDNWLDLQDYAPSTSALDNVAMRLVVHWKGVPNDLSGDPEVKHLHPQEVKIAQELKLPAGQYLANKRRIFEARLKSIRERKNFTKTAAQQACNIDVNKTSQLYEAYERVGWFDEVNFKQWLV